MCEIHHSEWKEKVSSQQKCIRREKFEMKLDESERMA